MNSEVTQSKEIKSRCMSKHSPLYKTRNRYKVGVTFNELGVVMSVPSSGLVPADNKLTSDWLESSFLLKINSVSSSFFFSSSNSGSEATPSTSLPPIGISSSLRSLLLVVGVALAGVASFIGRILVADSHQVANP